MAKSGSKIMAIDKGETVMYSIQHVVGHIKRFGSIEAIRITIGLNAYANIAKA